MRKGKFSLIFVLGICLILSSACLVIVFQVTGHRDAEKSLEIAGKMTSMLPERTPGVPGTYPDTVMPVLGLEGEDYVALLEIPAYGIALPVADRWDSSRLSCSRFYGSAYDHTLIIGGTEPQFAFCKQIQPGERITVTDMTGAQFTYRVADIDRAAQAPSQWLADPNWDLTLFCRDVYTTDYIAVRCTYAYNEPAAPAAPPVPSS